MLRFRETSSTWHKSLQENQGPPPNVTDVRKCQIRQIQDYVSVAAATGPSIARGSARDASGPITGRIANTGSC